MTGPEHYREAEKILAACKDADADAATADVAILLRFADVHATLAVAAALAGLDAAEGPGGGSATGRMTEDANEWARAVAPPVPTDGASEPTFTVVDEGGCDCHFYVAGQEHDPDGAS